MDRPWGMIKVSIFSFSIFGDFSELLVNSVLLSAFQYVASKQSVLTDPNFFFSKNLFFSSRVLSFIFFYNALQYSILL